MQVLNDYEVVVFNHDDLEEAVGTGNTYNYIYFGADIEMQDGITIDPGKTTLTIDGQRNGVSYTFTDILSDLPTSTLGIRETSSISITIKNLEIIGRNYYGVPYIIESSPLIIDTSGVSVIYENVTFNGRQLTFNPDGLTRYSDCDITINSNGQEVGEVCRLEFGGTNIIRHNSTADSVFWFRGAVNAAYLHVFPGASVDVTTANYFMYCLSLLFIARPVAYEFQENSSFTLVSDHGISESSGHRVSSFTVFGGASFKYTQLNANGTSASLYMNGALTVHPGADVYMQADFSSSRPLISFASGSDSITIDNPKSFVLYNSSNSVFATSVTRNFTVNAGQFNEWDDARPFPGAGGHTDTPNRKWKKDDWSGFSISGNISILGTSVTSSSFTPQELPNLPDLNDLDFLASEVIAIGNLPLTPDEVTDNWRPVSGTTAPHASVTMDYNVGGTDYSIEVTADETGSFSAYTDTPIPAGTSVYFEANTPFLLRDAEAVSQAIAGLEIVKAPERIVFVPSPIHTSPVLLPRQVPEDEIWVSDTRAVPSPWTLTAAVAEHLTANDGHVLTDSVVFVRSFSDIDTLGVSPTAVYTGGTTTGTAVIDWPETQGIMARLTVPAHSGQEYSTRIFWEVLEI